MAAVGSAAGQPLRGILHAGAVLESRLLQNTTLSGLRTEFSGETMWKRLGFACEWPCTGLLAHASTPTCRHPAGKVYGAQHLLQRSFHAPLCALHFFSSLAAFSGTAGQAGYAAANGVLDAWAHAAQGQGLPGLAVQWGSWGGSGMAVRSAGFVQRMERMGLGIGESVAGWWHAGGCLFMCSLVGGMLA